MGRGCATDFDLDRNRRAVQGGSSALITQVNLEQHLIVTITPSSAQDLGAGFGGPPYVYLYDISRQQEGICRCSKQRHLQECQESSKTKHRMRVSYTPTAPGHLARDAVP